MQFHLYASSDWAREVLCIDHNRLDEFSTYTMAILVRLKRATFVPSPYSTTGDLMSDDTSSSLRIVVPPTQEPLTLAQAKTFLRIEHSADDEPITRAITAARMAAEHYVRIALLPQTWDYSVANPSSMKLCLMNGPAQSIISITLTTEAGATSTMNAANYRLSVDGFSVLFTTAISIEKMTIRHVAGLANAVSDIPAPIIQGMLHHVTVILENRDGDAPLPMQAIACYEPFRRISL